MRALLVVPALFGTEIHDEDRGQVWGSFRCLYRGAPIGTLAGLRGRPGRVLRRFRVLPGLDYDIVGALIGALERAGYRSEETLHLYAYDWRLRTVELGAALAADIRLLAALQAGRRPLGLSTAA